MIRFALDDDLDDEPDADDDEFSDDDDPDEDEDEDAEEDTETWQVSGSIPLGHDSAKGWLPLDFRHRTA